MKFIQVMYFEDIFAFKEWVGMCSKCFPIYESNRLLLDFKQMLYLR